MKKNEGKIKKIRDELWVSIPSDLCSKYDLQDGMVVKIYDQECGIGIRKQMTPMDAVTVAANVSYRDGPTRAEMEEIFLSGELPKQFTAHLHRVLTETPWSILEDAAKQISNDQIGYTTILENLKRIGVELESDSEA